MKLSLLWKIMAAFVLVLAVGVGGVTVTAGRTTANEFRQYMGGGNTTQLIAQLADYYAQTGAWMGVETLFSAGMGGRGMMGRGGMTGGQGRRTILADARGAVVFDSTGAASGSLPASQLEHGVPITVKGQRVGTLLTSGGGIGGMMGAPEQNFLDRVNRAVLAAGIAAGVVALLLGFVVFWSITAPLKRLTRAAHAVAAGDLAQRVNIRTGDEIAELGAAFNTMAANLDQGEQVRRQMTADIAHELRTPLSVIQGNLEAILDGVYPADLEHIQPALDQTHLLARLVEDLRTLALAEAGQLSLDRLPTDVAELARRVVAAFESQAREKRVTLAVPASPALPLVHADAQRIAQVLTNLLGNALRHTPRDGRITVQVESAEGFVRVAVRDTGPGIAAEDLPHIFDRFYRADKSRARDASGAGGSGLGLAIARSIIAAHGGRIEAESTLGQGTTVAFTLPSE